MYFVNLVRNKIALPIGDGYSMPQVAVEVSVLSIHSELHDPFLKLAEKQSYYDQDGV